MDTNKDQSYFLWTLTQNQLSRILLPVGDAPKEQIRKEAEAAGIPVAAKKDSQGVCFLGHIDIPEFLSHFVDLVPGDVLHEDGRVIGTHRGSLVYTVGQLQGFSVTEQSEAQKPLYVIAKNLENNTITVSEDVPILDAETGIFLESIHWIDEKPVTSTIQAQFRYRQTPFTVQLTAENKLKLSESTDAVAPGQSCVLYDGSLCLGGGTITGNGHSN